MYHDPDGRLGRTEGKAAAEEQSDLIKAIKLLLLVPTLPVRIPLNFMKRRKQKQEMREFATSLRTKELLSPREIAVKWAEAHPKEYPFGAYAPELPRLEKQIQAMLASSGKRG